MKRPRNLSRKISMKVYNEELFYKEAKEIAKKYINGFDDDFKEYIAFGLKSENHACFAANFITSIKNNIHHNAKLTNLCTRMVQDLNNIIFNSGIYYLSTAIHDSISEFYSIKFKDILRG